MTTAPRWWTRIALAAITMFVCVPLSTGSADATVHCYFVKHFVLINGVLTMESKRVCVTLDDDDPGGAEPAGQYSAECERGAAQAHVAPEFYCAHGDAALIGSNGPTAPMIAAAVWRLRLPASGLHIQPVKGRTLVNLKTNFYATNAPIERTITLLGRRIRVRVWASRYTWTFGDGSTKSTTDAGAPYPDLRVTHTYLRKGRVRVRLSTRYLAQYRIGHGAWASVPGSADIASPTKALRVVTATPVLTG